MGGGNCYLDSNKPITKSLLQGNGLSFDSPSLALGWRRWWVQSPKFYFILGIIFNLCLLGFFKYTDFLLENFNAFSQIAHLDFNIPLPHILLPLALSFVTFQQIAFLFDCYKHATGQSNENLHIDFIDYALFISFFPQLIAGPIVHHREMMPQFAKMGANSACSDFLGSASAHSLQRTASASHSFASHNPKNSSTILEFADSKDSNESSLRDSQRESWQSAGFVSEAKQPSKHSPSQIHPASGGVSFDSPSLALGWRSGWVDSTQKSTINYEFLAKGIFIFSIGLFKKVFIADSFAKWANAGFSVVEKGGYLNIAESWATSLSYTFQLYFDFSGYCDMAIGLGLMFGIVLPLNFNSPYKSLNIAEFWRRWHITLGRFLKECLYIPLGGNRGNGNSSLARPSRELEKFSFDRQPALSQSNFSAQPTNLTQDTRIANDLRVSNESSLRGSLSEAKTTKQSKESTNLICIFIAKNKILQMPFSALKESIFATLKRQINFRSDLHKNKRDFRKPSTNLKSTNSANHAHTKALQK